MSGVASQPAAEEDKKPAGGEGRINLKVKGVQKVGVLEVWKDFHIKLQAEDARFSRLFCAVTKYYGDGIRFVQDGNEVFFRMKRSTQLKKLMNAYCERQSDKFLKQDKILRVVKDLLCFFVV
ncbi:hypothetical protein RJ640_004117 [Escallonia rubra]|uniref:Rad60/SUMO-like domain-containing protein n=1 Tax=Escallonia rubra TaxID=112253 RepID=A0AA88ULY7_9ASTE|nr:hypothetical protein RJ640_004117 [Escallonia rubra]